MSQLFLIGKVGGIIMFVLGYTLNYIVNRRRFKRRALTGIQVYRSYEHSWTTRLGEGIVKLIAILLIIAGILVFVGALMVPLKIK